MKASERKALVALLEKIAAELAGAEDVTEKLARDDIARRRAGPTPKAYENATHYPYQVGALGATARAGAESIRSAIRCYLEPRKTKA